MQDINTYVRKKIRQLRKKRGISQRNFCQIVGVNQSQLSKKERGVQLFSLPEIQRVANHFQIDFRSLVLPNFRNVLFVPSGKEKADPHKEQKE